MTTTLTTATNYGQSVVALVRKTLEELLRANPLPHIDPQNYLPANFVKGTNNTFRFINIPDLSVVAGTPEHTTPVVPWLKEGVSVTPEALSFGYEEFTGDQAGRVVQLSDIAMLESPFDLMSEAANRVARNAMATADKRVAEVIGAGTNVLYAGGVTTRATIPVNSPLTGALVKKAVAILADSAVPTYGDGMYHAIVRPGAVFDLMNDTAVGGWVDAARYAGSRALLSGELGEYAGVRFQQSPAALQFTGSVGPVIAGAAAGIVAATDTYTATSAHNLVTGDRVKLTSVTGATGLTAGTTYFVIVTGATTYKFATTLALALAGTAIDVTADSSAQVQNYIEDINSTFLSGPNAYAFGDWGSLQTYFTEPGGPGDELHQRASIGWKGFFGAMLLGQGTSATNVTGPRYIRIESSNPLN